VPTSARAPATTASSGKMQVFRFNSRTENEAAPLLFGHTDTDDLAVTEECVESLRALMRDNVYLHRVFNSVEQSPFACSCSICSDKMVVHVLSLSGHRPSHMRCRARCTTVRSCQCFFTAAPVSPHPPCAVASHVHQPEQCIIFHQRHHDHHHHHHHHHHH
jgi:hypothetical protein